MVKFSIWPALAAKQLDGASTFAFRVGKGHGEPHVTCTYDVRSGSHDSHRVPLVGAGLASALCHVKCTPKWHARVDASPHEDMLQSYGTAEHFWTKKDTRYSSVQSIRATATGWLHFWVEQAAD